jgi:hypothetical protein
MEHVSEGDRKMRTILATAVMTGALAAAGAVGLAGSQAAPAQPTAKSHASSTSHATTGTVKAIDDTRLVIARPGKTGGELTFSIRPSTHREGTVAIGSKVSVRYEQDGNTRVATAISAGASRQEAAAHAAAHATPAVK